jgi:hypothetical protein
LGYLVFADGVSPFIRNNSSPSSFNIHTKELEPDRKPPIRRCNGCIKPKPFSFAKVRVAARKAADAIVYMSTSTVTVTDPTALYGYQLTAQLLDDTYPFSSSMGGTGSVQIFPHPDNTDNPATCPNDATPAGLVILTSTSQNILSSADNAATGSTNNFCVRFSIPANATIVCSNPIQGHVIACANTY